MSVEDDISRQLHAKAASVRAAPKPAELAARIRSKELRATRHERLALGAAVVVLAASLGGLAGAFASTPRANPNNSLSTRYQAGGGPKTSQPSSPGARDAPTNARPPAPSVRTIIDRQLPGGPSITATVQSFRSPVAISDEWNPTAQCATGEIVTTTVGQGGSFGGGISVAELPRLAPDGLEILSSGILQAPGAGEEWWVTAAVGSRVTRLAAESLGGAPVTAVPSDGIAVTAGPVSSVSAATGEMSAVAEGGPADESLGFTLGSGPRAVGTAPAVTDEPGCSALSLPAQPPSASSSQPAEPSLAAGSIIAAFEQADSANPLLGFAANLAAVDEGGRLSSSALPTVHVPAKPSASVPQSGPAASGTGTVEVQQVSFLSASTAVVVYRVNEGVLLTGNAQVGGSGTWLMSLATFCSNLRSGIVQGDVPQGVVMGCQDQG
jgi:hypothetical protein